MRKIILPFLILFTPLALAKNLPLDQLTLPDGFHIEVYAEVPNARQLARGDNGTIYVASRRLGKVHAIVMDKQGKPAKVIEIASGLELPSGITWYKGDLYVGAVSTIYKYHNIDQDLASAKRTTVYDKFPSDRHHGWKFLDFGPDGLLYVPVGAPCNICLKEDPRYASIMRMDVNAKDPKPEVYVHGVRNTVGFDWHPKTGNLWFTDNGRDNMGDDLPPCEFNEVTHAGQHFGYPFFHGTSLPDPEFASKADPKQTYTSATLPLGPHVAPLGIHFYRGNSLPKQYHHQAFIAEHGSWNRTPEAGHTGHRVTLARHVDGKLTYEVFAEGWLGEDNVAWGRPVDLLELPDGSLLLSDDTAEVVYRITWRGKKD